MSIHLIYLQEYIEHLLRDLKTDKEFVLQGLIPYYTDMSKKESIELQWTVTEWSQGLEESIRKLEKIDKLLEEFNKKGKSG
jgi:hypothetical protein